MIKIIIFCATLLMFIVGCKNSLEHNNGAYVEYKNKDTFKKQSESNSVKLAKINANTKIDIAQIQSANSIKLATLKTKSMQRLANIKANTSIKTATINVMRAKQEMKLKTYLFMGITLIILVVLYIYYLINQRNRELRAKMHEDKLKQEIELKEREYFEQRLHKMIDLAADGKLPADMQQEIIHLLQYKNQKLLD